MDVIETIEATRNAVAAARATGRRIGLVPTMGALHAGHEALIDRCRAENDLVVVSIFVNPTQFGPDEDLNKYPRPLGADLDDCRKHGVDLVFHPAVEEMYARGAVTRIHVAHLADQLCGRHRPSHFDGVCTVVAKLLNIIQPDRAYFGEKDFQQLAVIRRMVDDLDMPVQIVGCPTVREEDGLAISSRNAYLTPQQRRDATVIHKAMRQVAERVAQGERNMRALAAAARIRIEEGGADAIDYVTIVDPLTLEETLELVPQARICVAAHFGGARLIDNVPLDAGGRPD
jgi:pantoate--beta-alanine ligase